MVIEGIEVPGHKGIPVINPEDAFAIAMAKINREAGSLPAIKPSSLMGIRDSVYRTNQQRLRDEP